MKTLLISINAKYIHTNNAVRLLKMNSDFPIEIFEYTIKDDIDVIINDIERFRPKVLGLSIYIWNVEIYKEILTKLSLVGSKIVIGGPEVSYDSEHFLKEYNVDFIVSGEGEMAFNSLLTSLSSNSDYSDISGLTYLRDNSIYNNPIVEIENLELLSLPFFLLEDIKHIPHKISYIESSRGCPYNCSYCLSSREKNVRFFNIESVKKTIMYLIEHGSKTIKFLDRTFNANKNTLELFKFIIEKNNNQTIFQFEITGDVLHRDVIDFLNINAPPGLFRFEIGIQSMNHETNLLVDRVQNNERLFENINMIQGRKIIDLHLDLIAGLPKEDIASFRNTFNKVFLLGAKELQLGFLKMLKGTKIRRDAALYNYDYSEFAPYEIKSNNSLSKSDIAEIHLVETMLEIYHNKGYFGENLLNYLLKRKDPYDFFYEIGKFYHLNNYSFKDYQIEDVYQRLFSFLEDKDAIFLLKKDYLNRSKIKPKIFWENTIPKNEKLVIFEKIALQNNLSINTLYKHSIIINDHKTYYVVLYHDLSNTYFEIKEDIK